MEDEVTDMIAEIRRRKPTFTPEQLANARPVVEVNHVSKRFCRDLKRSLLYGVIDIAREVTGREPRVDHLRKHEFWALSDVSLEIMPGRAVGIVGTNGSGKTTLMRTLAGLIKPTKGSVTVRGRMAPLLALGAGFIPVLTGRENIYTNMSILGLTKEEIDARFDKVVEFSEIGYALDAPVQSFSSGMMARLGFSCAVETQPDILLLDEVLAVGDLKFKEKCLMRLLDIRARGTSMIVVHHSTDLLEKLCDEIIYIDKGVVVARGDTEEVLDLYENDLDLELRQRNRTTKYLRPLAEKPQVSETSAIAGIRAVGSEPNTWMVGESGAIEVEVDLMLPRPRLNCRIAIHSVADAELGEVNGSPVQTLSSAAASGILRDVPAGRHVFRLALPVVRLPRGNYYVRASLYEGGDTPVASAWSASLAVNAPPTRSGGAGVKQFLQEHEWSFDPVPATEPAQP